MIILICQQCNKEFKVPPSRKNRKYCSRKCFGLAKKKHKYKKCSFCKKSFLSGKGRNRKFCSRKCFSQFKRQENPRISKFILKKLYLEENLSSPQLANKFNCSASTICHWLAKYSIPAKSPTDYKGDGRFCKEQLLGPSKIELQELVNQNKPTKEIANLYNCSKVQIGRLLKLYKIPPAFFPDRPKSFFKEPTPDKLRKMYVKEQMSTHEIAKQLGTSADSIIKRLRKYKIPVYPQSPRRFHCEDGHIAGSTYERKVDNWLYSHSLKHIYQPQCPFNSHYHADFKVNKYYIEVWGMHHSEYRNRKKYKQQEYTRFSIPLIQLYPKDFTRVQKGHYVFENKLSTFLLKSKNEQLLLE